MESHLRGKDHLKRVKRENTWKKARQNNYARQEYSEFKKDMTILQNMCQAKVEELNDYKLTHDKQRKELRELKDMVRGHEEKHITKVDFKGSTSFIYNKRNEM